MVNRRGKNCHSTEYSHMLYNVRNIFKSFYNRIYSSNLYLGTFISLSFKTGKGSKIDISEAFTTTHVYRTKKCLLHKAYTRCWHILNFSCCISRLIQGIPCSGIPKYLQLLETVTICTESTVAQSMGSATSVEVSHWKGLLVFCLKEAHHTYPATSIFGISPANASAISRLPTLAIQCRASPMKVGLRLARSFLIALFIKRISSLLEFTSTEMKRYPCVSGKRKIDFSWHVMFSFNATTNTLRHIVLVQYQMYVQKDI